MQVVQHAIDEISGELGIPMVERDEYTLFYVTESDHRYCPMTRDEYVMDVFDMLHELKNELDSGFKSKFVNELAY